MEKGIFIVVVLFVLIISTNINNDRLVEIGTEKLAAKGYTRVQPVSNMFGYGCGGRYASSVSFTAIGKNGKQVSGCISQVMFSEVEVSINQ